jgi:hypothetical protein
MTDGQGKNQSCLFDFCSENFAAGLVAYGGVRTWTDVTFSGASQGMAPVYLWTLSGGTDDSPRLSDGV